MDSIKKSSTPTATLEALLGAYSQMGRIIINSEELLISALIEDDAGK